MNEWDDCHLDDLWIYDKLILSKKLGYHCGPAGVPVKRPGPYIVKPIVNLLGMGRGASIVYIEEDTDDLVPPGHFWCELFYGVHSSVDYHFREPRLCVVGDKCEEDFRKFERWSKISAAHRFPGVLEGIRNYPWVNVEMIGGKIIEVHLRQNPDFRWHDADHIIPFFGSAPSVKEGYEFINEPEGNRRGYYIPV